MYRADLLLALEKTAIVLGCAAFLALLVHLAQAFRAAARPGDETPTAHATSAAFVFALLGIVTGLTMGASRVAVVANILPAALTFIGGLALWIVSRESKAPPAPGQIALVATAIMAFVLMLFFGTVLGAFERNRALYQASRDSHDIQRLRHEADVEFAINAYRDALGLAPKDFATPAKD